MRKLEGNVVKLVISVLKKDGYQYKNNLGLHSVPLSRGGLEAKRGWLSMQTMFRGEETSSSITSDMCCVSENTRETQLQVSF